MRRNRLLFSATFVATFLLGGPTAARAQSEITLLAPVPAREPIAKAIANFEAKTSYKIKATYVTGLAPRQMVAKGQPLDVNILIAPFPGALTSGAIIPSSQTVIASFQIAVAVPKGAPHPDISSAAAVKKALLAAKSVGYEDPDFTIAGVGPTEMMNKFGITDQIIPKAKVSLGPGGGGISPAATAGAVSPFQRIQDGDVDFSMLLLNELLAYKDKLDIVGLLPRKLCPPTPMAGFISTHASDPAGAKAFLEYLASPEAQALFKDAGFEPRS